MLNLRNIFLAFLFKAAYLAAIPQAVIFDWGNVLAFEDRSVVVNFMCETFHFSESDFEEVNLEKRKMVKAGGSDVDFWIQYAKEKNLQLSNKWPQLYQSILKASVGADPEMFSLVGELKKQHIRVGLLSNINDRYTKLIRDCGFYEPFDPCLLSCEMGFEKPHKESYEILLKALNLSPSEIVFIDDKLENIQVAQAMGFDAILFESYEQIRSELCQRRINLKMIEGGLMSYVKENQAKKNVVGISIRTTNEDGHFLKVVPPLWEKFYQENIAEKIPNRIDLNVLAVYTNYEKDYTKPFDYIIGCEVSNLDHVPKGLVGVHIDPSSYGVFTATGEYPQSVGNAWQTIWKSHIKRSYTHDFEVYPPDFNSKGTSTVKIYISTVES